jgi:uncharacterized membrane-anchored protein
LLLQFRTHQYVPWIYWFAVAMVSVFGTMAADAAHVGAGIPYSASTAFFLIVLAVIFAGWYRSEKTLSIHSIYTTRREGFYWLTILFTFALGTAAGDLVAESLNLGYWKSALMFGAMIAAVAVACFRFRLNAVLAFWLAYILTRPLGASIGDYLSQDKVDGGLGLGTTVTSFIFLGTILAVVIYLSKTRRDAIDTAIVT